MIPNLKTENSVEEHILGVVKDDPNLTANKIWRRITKQGISVTYNRVFEKLNLMTTKGILAKSDKQYSLNTQWVEKTTTFMETIHIKQMRMEKPSINVAEDIENVKLISFSREKDFYEFIREIRASYINNSKSGGDVYWMGNHAWGPIFYMKNSSDSLKKALEKNIRFHICIRGNTKIDRTVAEFYKKHEATNVIHGVGGESTLSIYIYGDVLLLVDHPYDISDRLNKIFKTADKMTDCNLGDIFEGTLNQESYFHVVMIKNEKLLTRYKNLIKSFF